MVFALGNPKGSYWDFLNPVIIFGLPFITTIGSGIMAALVKITLEEGNNWITPKKIFWKTLRFFLVQIIISPFVAFGVILGCGVATSAFNL